MDLTEAQERSTPVVERHPWEEARLHVVSRLLSRYASLDPGTVIVDIGCGDTFVVEQLARDNPGLRFYAVDTAFTDDLIARYQSRLRVQNVQLFRSLDDLPPSMPDKVSAVLLMDVVEHVEQDREFLRDLTNRPFLGAGTVVLVTVPAYQSLFCSHDTFLGHHRRYSNGVLRRVLEESGLRVVDIGYFFASLVPVRVLQAVRERVLGPPDRRTTGLVTWSGGTIAPTILKWLLVCDATVSLAARRLGITVPGLSNFAICRKSA